MLLGAPAEEGERPDEATVRPEFDMYWRAWLRLRHDRPVGALGGAGHIPFAAIDRYAQRMEIAGTGFQMLFDIVSAVDDEYIDWLDEREKAAAEERARRKGSE